MRRDRSAVTGSTCGFARPSAGQPSVGKVGLAARIEAFETRHRGSWWDAEYDENGWAATFAGKREIGPFTGLVELIHVSSDNPAREHVNLAARQKQTRLQADLRLGW